jgi:ADP-ribose pyrophosphatase YjhB (NUDIX family)
MNYCSECGNKVTLKIPDGDDLARFVCVACQTVHYDNPKMVVGAIPELNGKILLCQRAIEPAKGKWTLPAGYLENGETIAECAIRETEEEAGAAITDLLPYAIINLPLIKQVYFIFRARLVGDAFQPGPESLAVELISLEEIPWVELAFSSMHRVLEKYCADLKTAEFPFRNIDIVDHR